MGSKLLWSAWLLAVFVPVAAAQTPDRFEGRLVLADSEAPLAGASISIVGVTGSARTDADGRFTWAPAPPVAVPGDRRALGRAGRSAGDR